MGITYQEEFISYARHEVEPLAELEWEESGHPTEALSIDWDAYYDLEGRSLLKFFTARKDGLLVGYFVVILSGLLTSKGEVIAIYDSVYVHKDYRKSTVGKRMFDFVEKCLKEDGVSVLAINTKVHAPFDNLMQFLKFSLVERIYSKYIGD